MLLQSSGSIATRAAWEVEDLGLDITETLLMPANEYKLARMSFRYIQEQWCQTNTDIQTCSFVLDIQSPPEPPGWEEDDLGLDVTTTLLMTANEYKLVRMSFRCIQGQWRQTNTKIHTCSFLLDVQSPPELPGRRKILVLT